MSKSSIATAALPPAAVRALETLGENVRSARRARRMTVTGLAERMFVAPATLVRLERGHPGTSLGTLASALAVFELLPDLTGIADAGSDPVARFANRRDEQQRVRVRKDRDLDF